ncbi:UNKNOWN [Stylonychia lemnae]|uniref:Uncharacterized protein n=1 Tax=Stylonychia lemnae TaxID=5949 RepID=A0A078B0L6_STYLE|nr:UNKNOWN [Stylonychia lemnae]|eukprot:CDW88079.1 UNKNOWN [Stylonychia lemnae]
MASKQSVDLHGDGLVENLFHFIWSKDCLFKSGPQVLIPDTIIYRFEQPAFWYFSKKTDGTILRKNKKNLNNKSIEEAFLKNISGSGIVAVYIYNKTERNIVNVMNKQQKIRINEQQQDYDIEQDDELANANYDGLSIHQRKNSQKVLRIVWSPKICVFERKENLKDLYDQKYDMYERVVTYEGEDISQHISNVTFEKIRPNRMVLNFKIDKNDKIWLLWCSSLRIEGKTYKSEDIKMVEFSVPKNQTLNALPLRIEHKPSLPITIRHGQTHSSKAPTNLHRESKCLSCNFLMEPDRMYEITMKMVIQDHDLRAFKDSKYLVQREIQNPKDLVERQNSLLKGIEIKPAPKNFENDNADTQEKKEEKKEMQKQWKRVQSAGEMRKTDDFRTTQNWIQNILSKDKPKIKTLIIPFILKQLYPQMTLHQYQELKEDINFQNQTTYVCEECFLCISMSSESSGVKFKIPKPIKKVVLKKQEPEKIQQRRNQTYVRIRGMSNSAGDKYRSQSLEQTEDDLIDSKFYKNLQALKVRKNTSLDRIDVDKIQRLFATPKNTNMNHNISSDQIEFPNNDSNFHMLQSSIDQIDKRLNEIENQVIYSKIGRPPLVPPISKDKYKQIASKNRILLRQKLENIKQQENVNSSNQNNSTNLLQPIQQYPNSISSLATSISESPYYKEMVKHRKKLNLSGMLKNLDSGQANVQNQHYKRQIYKSDSKTRENTININIQDEEFHLPTI